MKKITINTKSKKIGRGKGARSITNEFYADSTFFLRTVSSYIRNKKKPSYAYMYMPTKIKRADLLVEFEKLYENLKGYEPSATMSNANRVSFSLMEPYDLTMRTGYGDFNLTKSGRRGEITIITPFNLSKYLTPLIAKASIVRGISETSLKKSLEKTLSKHPEPA
ncbi:MAG: hypothetical protein PHH54_00075 [Candidatus Nanoarchaeia archaeon]|nr:hypothetical protein [Candidatus Nanoarchaeia archaeon]MDD5740359.1 hypothetical protein [Candidatus Nanoarchaeia archaeon]